MEDLLESGVPIDEAGAINVSGFLGDYAITCAGKTSKFTLDNAIEPITVEI